MKLKALVLVGLTVALLVGATSANAARWILGNGPTDLAVTQPQNVAPIQVCTTRIHGAAGLSVDGDPADPTTPPSFPAPPYSPLTVRVYTGPAGSLEGATVEGGKLFTAAPAHKKVPLLKMVTTAPPTPLVPAEEYDDFTGVPIWEYAAAPFQIAIPSGKIAVDNDIVIVQGAHTAYVSRTGVACNQAKWRGVVWNIGSAGDAVVTRTNTALSVAIGTTGTVDPVATYFSDCTVAGDFDAQVHYKLNTWPPANAVRAGLLVNRTLGNGLFGDGSVTVERTSFAASGDVGSGEAYVLNAVDAGGGFLTTPTIATSGDLRASQTGGTITAYHRDSNTHNQWVPIGTSPGYPGPVSLALQVWSGVALLSGPAKVTFSKFAITKGACI